MTAGELVAVHPGTGELLDHLEQRPPADLADALAAIRAQQDQLAEWGKVLETELRRRLKLMDRKLAVFGDYEVATTTSRKSVWDVAELEVQIESLVEQGILKAGDVTEVIDRTPTVRAGAATTLIRRLDGASKRAIEQTRTWKEQSGKVTVVRSVELVAASEQGSLAPPPEAQQGPADPAEAPAKTYDFFRDGDTAAPDPRPTARDASPTPTAAPEPRPPASTRPPQRPAQPTPLDPEELFA